jgi:UPF0288 family protein (methanogenesis marker protein 3)
MKKEKFLDKFVIIDKKNQYAVEITTGKTFVYELLDDDTIQMIEPLKFEENVAKIESKLANFFEYLKNQMDRREKEI